jgi:hypothetical protein
MALRSRATSFEAMRRQRADRSKNVFVRRGIYCKKYFYIKYLRLTQKNLDRDKFSFTVEQLADGEPSIRHSG